MTRPSCASEGILTTQKIQALLDARVVGTIRSRKALAEAMQRAGEEISVHGIDAWFKHTDSNYAIPRPSLVKERPSYPVPRRRWSALFEIFGINEADLAANDAEFRRSCFARKCAAAGNAAPVTLSIACVAAADGAAIAAADRHWLAQQGCHVTVLECEAVANDSALLRALQHCHLVLFHVSPDSATDRRCLEVLDFVRAHDVPLLAVTADPATSLPRPCPRAGQLLRPANGGTRYQGNLSDHLHALADAPLSARAPATPFWPAQQPVTDRPSIAVLPFANLTGSGDHDLFADGMTEDLTTLLARIPEFFVIAHSTTRIYQDALPDCHTLHRQLGVRYVLEGSIRCAGDALRITAQLVDAVTGAGLWSRRFDRRVTDPFAIQDELTAAICAQIEPQLRLNDIAYGTRNGGNVTSWRLWQEGWYWLFIDAPAPIPERSLRLFRKALEIDPDYALAHAGIAIAICTGTLWGGLRQADLELAAGHAETACKLLPENPVALYAMGMMTFTRPGGLEEPMEYLERAVELEPSNPMYQGVCGYLLANLGRTEEGLAKCLYAMRLSPKDSREPFLCYMLGNAYIAAGEYQQAIETMSRCHRFSEVDFIWLMIAFSYMQQGDPRRALACLRRITKPRPYRFYRYAVMEKLWLGLPRDDKEAFLELLPKAGINAAPAVAS